MILPGDKVYNARRRRYGVVQSVNLDSVTANVDYNGHSEETRLSELERYSLVNVEGPLIDKMVYVAHPLGPDGPTRDANRKEAALWAAALARQYRVSVCADWIVLSGVWPETPELRTLGIGLDLIQVGRCDEVWITGPRVSEGMSIEGAHAAVVEAKPVRSFIGLDRDNLPINPPEMLDFRDVVKAHLRGLGEPQPLGLDYSGH
jgi:hypothetical protein